MKTACPEPAPSGVEGLSRRALLAGACAVPALPRHAGLDPASTFFAAEGKERWIPDQAWPEPCRRVPHDEQSDDRWNRALALYARAEAALEAVARTEDDRLYDRALGRHNAALARLLRTAAPDLAAAAQKLDLILRHAVFELSFGERCFLALQGDLSRLAALASRSETR